MSRKTRCFLVLWAVVFSTIMAALPPDDVRAFHQRLKNQEPDWFKDEEVVSAYYTIIEPPALSTPNTMGVEQWEISDVAFSGKPMPRQPDGSYKMDSLSLKITSLGRPEHLSESTQQPIVVTCGGTERAVSFKPTEILRKPVLKEINSFQEFVQDPARWLVYAVIWRGVLPPEDDGDEESGEFTFKSLYGKHYTIRPRAMAVTYRKDTHRTKLFFDFSGDSNQDFTKIYSKELPPQRKRSAPTVPETVYRVIDHKLHLFNPKDITYAIFDSPAVRSAWLPEQRQLYNEKGQLIVCLPDFYAINVEGGRPDASVVWVFREDESQNFYEAVGQEEPLATTYHIYSDGYDHLFLTRHLKRKFKKYCPANGSSYSFESFEYLRSVPKMSLTVNPDQQIVGGHSTWPKGVYRRDVSDPWKKWHQEGTGGVEIVIATGSAYDFLITYQSSSAEESYVQCDASQRSWWSSFPATVFRANKRLLEGLKTWEKLTNLNMGSLNLESVDWKNVLEAIGTMNQLTTFQFTNNSLILNFNDDYDQLAGRVADYHVQLGECLVKLTRLKELQIQGLWLRPRSKLGEIGAGNKENVSKEVAMTTGLINHNSSKGISKILESLCKLPILETLSMDGIPDHGSSYFSRRDGITQGILFPWWMTVSLPFAWIDGHDQCDNLKKLATKAVDDLGQRSALKKVFVYAPGENCFDYFSKFFWERLKAKKPSLTGERRVL